MTKAVTLAELADQNVLTATDNKVGIATTNPQSTLQVGTGITMNGNTGVITAQAYYGDGSNLTGVDSTTLKDTDDTVRVQATTTGATITGDLTVDNISVGGTITYDDVTNVDSVGIVTARSGIVVVGGGVTVTGVSTFYSAVKVGTGITIDPASGIITATKFSGDGSGLIGVASTDNIITGTAATFNNVVKVGTGITMDATSGIITATEFHGDGSNLTFAPRIIAFDPAALSTGVAADTNITITFDQNIEFYGTGTIELRSTSASGTVIEDFNINGPTPPSGLSISGTQLIINPTNNLSNNTVVYVILPVQGIRATSGQAYYAGSSNYNFRTVQQSFTAEGGDFVYTVYNTSSPTNYYKYHVFTNPGIATFTSPVSQAADFQFLMVGGGGGGGGRSSPQRTSGGGGGGGGVIHRTGSNLGMTSGDYNVTIGAGGTGGNAEPCPDDQVAKNGSPTIFSGSTTLTAWGGGAGGQMHATNDPHIAGNAGGSSGGGSGGQVNANVSVGSATPLDPTQGNTGGLSYSHQNFVPNSGYNTGNGGGGGGAGGAGGNAHSFPSTPPAAAFAGGNGGPGAPFPAFASPNFAGNVPDFPASTLSAIGPTGLFGGGGGGGFGPGPGYGQSGLPGPGGGGGGYPHNNGLGGNTAYDPYPSAYRQASAWEYYGKDYTGGGGGASAKDHGPEPGDGGKGVVIFRYETPAP